MAAFDGCFLRMEKMERTMKAKPILMAAEANKLPGFILVEGATLAQYDP